jgi:orotate phosphoribosyltransferase-like protein
VLLLLLLLLWYIKQRAREREREREKGYFTSTNFVGVTGRGILVVVGVNGCRNTNECNPINSGTCATTTTTT